MLNKAQEIIFQMIDSCGGFWSRSYKAPHAPRESPPRPRNGRSAAFRLFKGHRP